MGYREKLNKSFPKGFHPTDEEIIEDLQLKVLGRTNECIIPHVDVHEQDEAWDLASMINDLWEWKLKEWCFICCYKGKYKNGKRQCRTTRSGYWKVTGKERMVRNEDTNKIIGIKKTLVFHTRRVPKGKRTNWVMHEYHLAPKYLAKYSKQDQLSYIGCRLRKKKDKKTAKGSTSESDQEDNSISISNSSNSNMETRVAEDETITMSDNPDSVVTDRSSVVVVEDKSHSSCNVAAETAIAKIPEIKEVQIGHYPGLALDPSPVDFNHLESFFLCEFFSDDDNDDDDEWKTYINWEN